MFRYRAGIIGAGRVGVEFEDCHARAYTEIEATELSAIIDTDIDKAIAGASKWKVHVAGSEYWQVGELGLDIISICTPPQTHCRVLKDMLLANPGLRAIYCEKPIAIKLSEAREMVELCKANNIILQVNHQRRFGIPTFFYSRGIFNTGTHMIDMLRIFFGDPVEIKRDELKFERLTVKLMCIDTDKHIFEFKIPTDNLIKRGVEHLVNCIDNDRQSLSSGEEALKDLEVIWELRKKS